MFQWLVTGMRSYGFRIPQEFIVKLVVFFFHFHVATLYVDTYICRREIRRPHKTKAL